MEQSIIVGHLGRKGRRKAPSRNTSNAASEAAAARLLDISKGMPIDQDLMSVGKWNSTFLWRDKVNVAEYIAWLAVVPPPPEVGCFHRRGTSRL